MKTTPRVPIAGVALLTLALAPGLPAPIAPASALADDPPVEETTAEQQAAEQEAEIAERLRSMDPVDRLLLEIEVRQGMIEELRAELALVRLEAEQARNELTDLRTFIADHAEFGEDFARYTAIREIAEREQRRLEVEAGRARRDAEREERRRRWLEARSLRDERRAEENREKRYERAGFEPLGLDVYGGRMAYSYSVRDSPNAVVEYDTFLGLYYRPGGASRDLDFGSMRISGAVLNGSEEVRNVGVAITFFDENGNQVGSEIVKVANARPDVPYPFSTTVSMALDRPFTSSSIYVLYADPIAPAE